MQGHLPRLECAPCARETDATRAREKDATGKAATEVAGTWLRIARDNQLSKLGAFLEAAFKDGAADELLKARRRHNPAHTDTCSRAVWVRGWPANQAHAAGEGNPAKNAPHGVPGLEPRCMRAIPDMKLIPVRSNRSPGGCRSTSHAATVHRTYVRQRTSTCGGWWRAYRLRSAAGACLRIGSRQESGEVVCNAVWYALGPAARCSEVACRA